MMKDRRRRNFFNRIWYSRTQIINGIVNEIELQEWWNFVNRIFHSRIEISNEILNEIEIQEWRKPAADEIFLIAFVTVV